MVKTSILGTEYEFGLMDLNNPESSKVDGKCYVYDKRILVRHPDYLFTEADSREVKKTRLREVILHELIHAYNYESGCQYDNDEVLVDWMAGMLPKILASYNDIIEQLREEEDGDTDK